MAATIPAMLNGCTPSAANGEEASGRMLFRESLRLEEVVRWGDTILLEENEQVSIVSPRVTPDRRVGFIVADPRRSQVQLYGAKGNLRGAFGTRGDGPAEFQRVVASFRNDAGELLAVDMTGKLAVFDSLGTSLVTTYKLPFAPVFGMQPLDGDRLLISARKAGDLNAPLIHVWRRSTQTVEASFFPMPSHPKKFDPAYGFTGFTDMAVRGDTIAVLFSLSDTLFLFDDHGGDLGKVPIPFERFRRLTEPLPSDASATELQEWTEKFSTASHVFWLPETGTFLVQFFDVSGVEPQWRLLGMERNGQYRFEVVNTPRLLAHNDSALFFLLRDPERLNRWQTAYLRD